MSDASRLFANKGAGGEDPVGAFKPKFVNASILLHENIPKPLHCVNPRSITGDEWWNETRRFVYRSNNFCCCACGTHKTKAAYHQWLEAHEDYYIAYEIGRMYIKSIVGLCHACHNYIHSGRLLSMTVSNDGGDYTVEKFWEIIRHGNSVLESANLKPNPFALAVAENMTDTGRYVPDWARKVDWHKLSAENPIPDTPMAAWSRWRLVFQGNEYEPKFKNETEWAVHYGVPVNKNKYAPKFFTHIFGRDDDW